MKKVFALSMAAAMVMSLSAVSMAASNSDLKDEDGDVIGVLGVNQDTMLKWDSNLRDMIYWTEDGTENGDDRQKHCNDLFHRNLHKTRSGYNRPNIFSIPQAKSNVN